MLFNSLHFFLFLPTVFGLYFWCTPRLRWMVLLLASCYFYMAFIPKFILILFALILIDYFMGLRIEKENNRSKKKWYFLISIFSNLGILFLFKYFNFFNENIGKLAEILHWNYSISHLNIILPIGLSFHTFQSLSYIIEVYRGNQKAEKNLGVYALYVLFFPQLVAGPIERPQNMLHQFHEPKKFQYPQAVSGLRLMLWGFFKKIVIADNAALIVNAVFDHASPSAPLVVLATVLFAFQIYGDFSGYTDIARGCARMLGFELMKNFDSPYLSTSISNFWRRWHISLSSWFRDYVYIPLGGNRVGTGRALLNLFLTFMVSGLWHGANWTFVVWGALHGVYLIVSLVTKPLRDYFLQFTRLVQHRYLQKTLQVLFTFVLVDISWVFFRAHSLSQAISFVNQIPSGIFAFITHFWQRDFLRDIFIHIPLSPVQLGMLLVSIGALLLVESSLSSRLMTRFAQASRPMRYAVYYTLILWIFFFGYFGELPFIYFQF